MRTSRPRDAETSKCVMVRDYKTGKSESKTYYETTPDEIFALLDQACEDAPTPEPQAETATN